MPNAGGRTQLVLLAFAALASNAWTLGCSRARLQALSCTDTQAGHREEPPWILRLNETQETVEMVVHVPAESVRNGVPEGGRLGRVVTSERAYEITIPADSGGLGTKAWSRMQFSFQIDRFTSKGTLEIGA